MPVVRNRLQHAPAVPLGVGEGDILPHAGDLHRLAEHFAPRGSYFLHGIADIVHRDDEGRMLRRPVRLFGVKTAVDRTRLPGAVLG